MKLDLDLMNHKLGDFDFDFMKYKLENSWAATS